MSKNEVFDQGDDLALEVGTGVESGSPVRVGIVNGVAQTDSGDLVNTANHSNISTSFASGFAKVKTNGVHNLSVTLAADRAAGTAVYAISGGGNKVVTLTDSASGNKLFGALYKAEKSGTKVVPVLISAIEV